MNLNYRTTLCVLGLAGSLALAAASGAQQVQSAVSTRGTTAYSVARESVLTGSVVSFTEGTSRAGSHLILNTSSGVTDVNVGNAKLLSLNGMTFAAGDSIRITGETLTVAGDTFFAARIVQKGAQSLIVRSERGFMARPTQANVPASALKQGGVL